MTTSENEWYNELQQIATSGTTSDNDWYNERRRVQPITASENKWQRVITNDNERQRVVILANFPFFFFWIREESTTMHPKETL